MNFVVQLTINSFLRYNTKKSFWISIKSLCCGVLLLIVQGRLSKHVRLDKNELIEMLLDFKWLHFSRI